MSVYISPTYTPTESSFLSRASTKTYFDASGVMQTAAVDEAAYDHEYNGVSWVPAGLSVEGAATNLLKYSEQFDNTRWVKQVVLISSNSTTTPDGSTTADKMVVNGGTALGIYQIPVGYALNTDHTLSVFVKAAELSKVELSWNGSSISTFDVSSGQLLSGTGTISYAGDGWYKCSCVMQRSTSGQAVLIRFHPEDRNVNDGTSGIYIWGAQLEEGSYPTSYIPTTTTTETRAADVLSPATYPLNHARIGYQNFVPSATVTPSTEATGFEADSIQNQLTYEFWRPTAMPADVVIDMGANKTVNYVGMAAHTLGSDAVSVAASYSTDGVSYTAIDATASPTDNSAIMLLFTPVSARYIKLAFTGASVFSLGVVYVGQTLDMYRPFYSGHTPDAMARRTVVKPTKSIGGQWLGRSVSRQGFTNSYAWKNIPINWYRNNVDPFAVSCQKYPFFIAWNILEEPEDLLYAWTSKDIMPQLSGTRDLVEFGFDVEGVGND